MNLLQLSRCMFGVHQRDRHRARHDGSVARSFCTGCGKPMVKDSRGWHLEDPVAAAASD